MAPRYINPYTDFGFKKLFGEEGTKDLLIDFLNQLLPERHQIAVLTFRNSENLGVIAENRNAIFDINCISQTGERFIVEMQKAKIHYFKDRALFYTTFPIQEQAGKGSWNFKLDPIYYIAILDFFYDVEEEKAKVRRDVKLRDQDCEVFFEKIHYIFLQMPAFKMHESELETRYDKWLYFLKNLEDFNEIPGILQEPIFEKAFDVAELSNFNAAQLEVYQKSKMAYWDLFSMVSTSYEDGMEQGIEHGIERGIKQGIEQGIRTVAVNALNLDLSIDNVIALTGLNREQVELIQQEIAEEK
ncbi:MAG: Rpn family recombination-promoting nuclease/putative transposase [Saprospiraceae bacterium]